MTDTDSKRNLDIIMSRGLTRIVFENDKWAIWKTDKVVQPMPIGEPIILERHQKVDGVTPYPYDRTIYKNARFITSFEEEVKRRCPSSANAYSLGECKNFGDAIVTHERYALQFHRV